jgi:quercetin dioxygenase-like cupin family protein
VSELMRAPAPFLPFVGNAGPWEWRGEARSGTRRAVSMLAQPEQVGNSQVMIALARIPAGQAAPWHWHEDWEEFVYVLEGEGDFWSEGQPVRPVGPGSINVIPPRTWHTHRGRGAAGMLFLWGYAPPGAQLQQ